jgi:hypothetical protein
MSPVQHALARRLARFNKIVHVVVGVQVGKRVVERDVVLEKRGKGKQVSERWNGIFAQ